MNKPTYYPINEETARVANDINSFRTYEAGSATNEYKANVDSVYKIVDLIEEKKPQLLEKALYMADRYARKYAEHLNSYYRNEASCPSVMICGPANFPVKKKNKQNARRETLMNEAGYLQDYKRKITNLLTNEQPIKAGDADAIERLQDKIADLEAEKELMKAINAHYRKHNNLDDFEQDIPANLQRHIDFMIKNGWATHGLFDTANTNAELKRLQSRLDKLQAVKEAGTTETEYEDFKVIENTEIMRLQLIFDSKPDEETRNILKSNGFKWAPSQEAWQRQLTDNAKFALKRVLAQLA